MNESGGLQPSLLAALAALDTPTVCNALEVVAPERRGTGFTTSELFCARPDMAPIVGYARTAKIKAEHPSDRTGAAIREHRLDYYRYVDDGPKPAIMVIEDCDRHPGFGAWWGEVHTNVHKGLGCLGVVTNGSIRDLPANAEGFQLLAGCVGPSHAYVRVESFAEPVTVAGMAVQSGDLIHADRHGAVVIPADAAAGIPAAADLIARREAVIIEASRQSGFTWRELADAIRKGDEIH